MKKIVLLVLSLCICFGIEAQTKAKIIPFTYVAKLKKEHRNSFSQKSLDLVFDANTTVDIKRSFALHQPIVQKDANDKRVDLSLIYTIKIPDNEQQTVLEKLSQSGLFEYVEPKYIDEYLYLPNDSRIGNQWHLNTIQIFDAWDICSGDTNVVIGISDSGLDTTVLDLKDNIKINYQDPIDGIDNDNDGFVDNYYGWNVAANNNDITKVLVHGTFVAGISSSKTDNNTDLAGVGFHCKFLPIKNQDATLGLISGYESIVYAADHGCQIINCSWGGVSPYSQFNQDIINYATYNRGCLVVAAAGNTSYRLTFYPAAYDNVLSVTASTANDELASWATYDYSVDIMAPGDNIYSTYGTTFGGSNGTSFSAPIVSAVAALVKSFFPNFTAKQITHRLKATADNVDTIGNNHSFQGLYGAGRINAYRALSDTLMPSFECSYFHESQADDTLTIQTEFTNYLADASNFSVKVTSPNSDITLLQDSVYIGAVAQMQTSNSTTIHVISTDKLACEELVLRFDYFEGSRFLGYEYKIIKRSTTLDLDTNNQLCTITDCGRLGYDDPYFRFGNGICKKTDRNSMLCLGSFLFATNSSTVSDNILGTVSYQRDMKNIALPQYLTEDAYADMHIRTVFNDDYSAGNKLSIEVQHDAFAWAEEALSTTTFHQYKMVNTTNNTIEALYAALYMDWDIGISTSNRALYDEQQQISYVEPIFDGSLIGIKFLSDLNHRVYAFDNDGSNLSMKIDGGMTEVQKYNAMTTNRLEAGLSDNGNDVSTMTSYGPLSIAAYDTTTVAFAIIMGNNIAELRDAAIAAQTKYDSLINPAEVNVKEDTATSLLLYPNPSDDRLFIESQEIIDEIEIYNVQGQIIQSIKSNKNKEEISIKHLPKGIYPIKIRSGKQVVTEKIHVK